MDLNATDTVLLALQAHQSADILELFRIFILDVYLKNYGKTKIFTFLQRAYDHRYNRGLKKKFRHNNNYNDNANSNIVASYSTQSIQLKRSLEVFLCLFVITWFLRSPLYSLIAKCLCHVVRLVFSKLYWFYTICYDRSVVGLHLLWLQRRNHRQNHRLRR